MHRMCFHPQLMEKLNLRFGLSAETGVLIHFYHQLNSRYSRVFPKCEEVLKKVKRSPKFTETLLKMSKSPWRNYLCMNTLANGLESPSSNEKDLEIQYTLVTKLLE